MTSKIKLHAGVALCAMVLTGCSTSEDPRIEGVALSGGNAIAHNSALQIINPWPHGVTQTDIAVPAHPAGPSGNSQPEGGSATETILPTSDLDIGDLS